MGPRETAQQIRIVRHLRHAFLERGRRQRIITFRQGEFAAREVNVAPIRSGLLRRGIDFRQHILGIRSEQQRRAAKHHQVRRVAVGARPAPVELPHLIEPERRHLGPAVGKRDVAPQPHQTQALGQNTQRLRQRLVGRFRAALREQNLDPQQLSVFATRHVLDRRRRLF